MRIWSISWSSELGVSTLGARGVAGSGGVNITLCRVATGVAHGVVTTLCRDAGGGGGDVGVATTLCREAGGGVCGVGFNDVCCRDAARVVTDAVGAGGGGYLEVCAAVPFRSVVLAG